LFENALRLSLIISGGNFLIFLRRPISATFVFVGSALLLSPIILRAFGKQRLAAKLEDKD
jgi:TctA family transporter